MQEKLDVKTAGDTKSTPLVGKLGQGLFALIDECDLEIVSAYRWYLWHCHDISYARTYIGRKVVSMHRLIMGFPENLSIDHINHDGLDNRRKNLRICSHRQNLFNRKIHKNSRSGLRGVYLLTSGKIQCQIRVGKKNISLGHFQNLVEAAIARDIASLRYYGEFAFLNYPERKKEYMTML